METRANYVLIGLFTVLVVAASFGFVYWFGRYGEATDRRFVDIVFEGAVTGLSTGSAVQFNGIKVGEVTQLSLDPENPAQVIGRTRIDASTPIKTDTSAQLEYQGITGVAYIQLAGGDPQAPILPRWRDSGEIPVMKAERSAYQDIVEGARDILGYADSVLRRFDTMLASNEQAITNTVRNAETLTANLAEGSDDLGRLMASAGQFSESFSAVSGNLESLVTNLDELVEAVRPEAINNTLSNVEAFSETLASSGVEVTAIVADVRQASGRINTLLDGAEGLSTTFIAVGQSAETLITDLNAVAAAVNPEIVSRAVTRFDEVMNSVEPETIRAAVAGIEEFSTTLSQQSDTVTDILANARSASERVNTVLEGAEGLTLTFRTVGESATRLVGDLERITEAVDPERVSRTIANVENFSNALAGNTDQVEQIVANANELSAKLNGAADRVDTILAKAESYVEGESGEGFIQEATLAAQSFRRLSATLEQQVGVVVGDISQFTSGGLQDFEAMISDGRRTLSSLDRVVSNLERNPRGFLFGSGGGTVPEYRR